MRGGGKRRGRRGPRGTRRMSIAHARRRIARVGRVRIAGRGLARRSLMLVHRGSQQSSADFFPVSSKRNEKISKSIFEMLR